MKLKFYYKIILSYKGTNYKGWQFQTVTSETVQCYVEKVIAKIVNYQEYQVIGASRTDAGVHASGQVLKIVLPKEIAPERLMLGMNSKLPSDIRVISAEFIDESFNVNRDPISKEYHYYFVNKQNVNMSLSESILSIPEDMDMNKIIKVCELFIGEHNFYNFCGQTPKEKNTTRVVSHCSIEKTSFLPFESEIFYLKIEANGFLKYMVRFIMGALISIGKNELTIEDLELSIKEDHPLELKKKAPPVGLHLYKINY